MMEKQLRGCVCVMLAAMLAACGGGGEGGTSAPAAGGDAGGNPNYFTSITEANMDKFASVALQAVAVNAELSGAAESVGDTSSIPASAASGAGSMVLAAVVTQSHNCSVSGSYTVTTDFAVPNTVSPGDGYQASYAQCQTDSGYYNGQLAVELSAVDAATSTLTTESTLTSYSVRQNQADASTVTYNGKLKAQSSDSAGVQYIKVDYAGFTMNIDTGVAATSSAWKVHTGGFEATTNLAADSVTSTLDLVFDLAFPSISFGNATISTLQPMVATKSTGQYSAGQIRVVLGASSLLVTLLPNGMATLELDLGNNGGIDQTKTVATSSLPIL